MTTNDMQSKVNQLIDAWNRRDHEGFLSAYAEDARIYDPQYAEPLKGREAIRKDFEGFITAFPDLKLTLGALLSSGETAAFEVNSKGTHKGPFAGPDGQLEPTDRAVEMALAVFLRRDENGLIAEERRYYDIARLMQQLGQEPGRMSA